MSTPDQITAQTELEQWCRNIGADRALAPGWERGAQGCLGDRVAALYVAKVRQIWERSKSTPGRQSHIWGLMHSAAAVDHVALESLVHILGSVGNETTLNSLGAQLGKRAEMVLFLTHPSWGQSKHLKGLKLASGGSLDMTEMLNRLKDKGFRKAEAYRKLEHVERVALGALFIEIVAESTKLIEIYVQSKNHRKKRMVRYTDLYWQFLGSWKQGLKIFRPLRLPMICPPRPWEKFTGGGFLTLGGYLSTVDWARWPEVSKHLNPCTLESINYLQSVPHVWDHSIVEFALELWDRGHEVGGLPKRDRMKRPEDAEFREKGLGPSAYWLAVWEWKADRRKDGARAAFIHAAIGYGRLKLANQIHWVWSMDHRGRLYQRGAQLVTQGGDHYRSMFKFQEQSPVKGHERTLGIAIARAFGKKGIDKGLADYFDMMQEVYRRVGDDPYEHLAIIKEAKEPFRFVQLCRDWAGYCDDPGYTSGTIHWMDQTCSGWGHVACLTEDGVLAQYTNVTGAQPVDLYMGVGKLVEARIKWRLRKEELEEKERACLDWWHQHEIPRSLWKSVLMPVIYGRSYLSLLEVTQLYCRDTLNNFLNEDGIRIYDLARVFATALNDVVNEALPNIKDLSKWLSLVAGKQIDAGLRPYWFTPNGLAVESYASQTVLDTIELNLAGRRMSTSIRQPDGNKLDKRKTARKLIPDFIHSMDGAFLQRFVAHWKCYGHPINTVHDCFGTTLQHSETLRAELNDQWARFYSIDYLELHRQMVMEVLKTDIPEPPKRGTLDRKRIGENPYLFV